MPILPGVDPCARRRRTSSPLWVVNRDVMRVRLALTKLIEQKRGWRLDALLLLYAADTSGSGDCVQGGESFPIEAARTNGLVQILQPATFAVVHLERVGQVFVRGWLHSAAELRFEG